MVVHRRHMWDNTEPQKVVDQVYDTYDYVEFTVATGTTNYDVQANQSSLFANVPKAWLFKINTDQDITVRFNSATNSAITLNAGDSPFEFRNILSITNIYITNASGSTANIKILLV